MNPPNEHAIPAELKAALEKQAQARDASGSYARIFLAVFPALREAIANEIACATAPNDVATSIGSIFGQVTTELLALKVTNPAFIIGHAQQAYTEQCVNMMVQAAGLAAANAPRHLRKGLIIPGGTG